MNLALHIVLAIGIAGALCACRSALGGGTVSGGGAYAAGGTPTVVDIRPPVPVSVGYSLPAANSYSFQLVVAPKTPATHFEIRDAAGGLLKAGTVSVTLEFEFVPAQNRIELKVDGTTRSTNYPKIGTVSNARDPIVEPYTTSFYRKDRVSFTMYGVTTYFDVRLP